MAVKKRIVAAGVIPDQHELGLSFGVKFQVFDYEPIEASAFYKSSGLPGETPEALGDRVAAVVMVELDKRVKELMGKLTELRKQAFEELSDGETDG